MTLGGEIGLSLSALAGADPCLSAWRQRLPGKTALFSTGRAALRGVLGAIRAADPAVKTFLLPSYLCESVLAPFARAGIAVRFYPVAADLRLPVESLGRLRRDAGAGGVLFIDYFGFPVPAAEREAFLDLKREAWVVEDCVPGGLVEGHGESVGSVGHFSFASFRKSTPLPDGALVWNRSELAVCEPEPVETPEWVRRRVLGKLLRAEFLTAESAGRPEPALEAAYLRLFADSESALDRTGGEDGVSRLSAGLAGFDADAAAAGRRANFETFKRLFERAPVAWAAPLVERSTTGASPNLFPIACPDRATRDGLRARLAERRVFCAVHWPATPAAGVDAGGAARLAETMLGLPLGPRMSEGEVASVHAAVAEHQPSR